MGIKGTHWKEDDRRYKNKKRVCAVEGCSRFFYAKDFCRYHYSRYKKFGSPIYNSRNQKIIQKCSVPECDDNAKVKGFCRFHYCRYKNGTDLTKSKGTRGPLNHRWNGGSSEYPNHYVLKKIRKLVLEEENYTCHFCGKPTNQIHHIDGSKINHNRSNLTACCHSCNLKFAKTHKSKYTELYGRHLKVLSKELMKSMSLLSKFHKQNKLRSMIMSQELKDILF